MSDDEADPELLDLLRKSLGISTQSDHISSDIRVLRDAEYVYNNSIDVAIDRRATVSAASLIWSQMQQRSYSTKAWAEHELHPKAKDESTLNFIFTMDLLNFSFWSELDDDERFSIQYRGKRWTGYWSLVACLQRALDEGIPITSPSFWLDEDNYIADSSDEHVKIDGKLASDSSNGTGLNTHELNASNVSKTKLTRKLAAHIFRSETAEEIPLLDQRMDCLREAGRVLDEDFDGSVVELVQSAKGSAGMLVNLLAHHFPSFRDETRFDGEKVRFLKRAQIFVADVWAAFEGEGYGKFHDIDNITMFADYRVPQMLHTLGCLSYSPVLNNAIQSLKPISSGHSWEVQLRGCSIWSVELIRREILKKHPNASVNAILIDFFLYDLAKEHESAGAESIPHHRTRSIWY